MKILVSCAEAARLDAATASKAAIPSLLLMEDASVELWRALEPLARARGAGNSGLLLALCGPGNNGGDALALLRHARFSGLRKIAAVLSRANCGELGSLYAASLSALGLQVLAWDKDRGLCEALMGEATLIVDGISGSGLEGPLRTETASILAVAQASGAPIAAIDLPSGLSDSYDNGFPLLPATWTLSIEPRKACLYYPEGREACGEIIPIEGIFPADEKPSPKAMLLEDEDLRTLAPQPSVSAYKGERGRVAVFAGSIGASGAAVLASRSCLAAGAGIAALFASKELYPVVACMLESVMAKPEPADGIIDAKRWDSLLIGPGWGRGPGRLQYLAALLGSGLPAVLDADAIALYHELLASGFSPGASIILTPHPGEFAALTGIDSKRSLANPPAFLPQAAKDFKAVIILKSQVTWIASPGGEMALWEGRESGLGTAGSGDVLAGLAAGLLASLAHRSPDPAFDAARAAVIAHGRAGREARSSRGWFEAGAIMEEAARILGCPFL